MLLIALAAVIIAADPEPISYSISFPAPDQHTAVVRATIPTGGADSLDLFIPVWSPGFYHQEDYAAKVKDLAATGQDGAPLRVSRPAPNRWRITTAGAPTIIVAYALLCDRKFVTTNWVGPDCAILNGPATFITTVDPDRPYRVTIDLPPGWEHAKTGLTQADPDSHTFTAPNYDTLADSPIAAGTFDVREFTVGGSRHELVSIGELGPWNPERPVDEIRRIVAATRDMWGWRELPFDRYVFLLSFGPGGGGLEHLNSTLITTSPTGMVSESGYLGWLGLVSHEYFHAFNVKRLRPVELGPFDYENPPTTSSLWISEGLTSYYGDLMVRRAGLSTQAVLLRQISGHISQLQNSPGRLLQTLSQSSEQVWTTSTSGVRNDPAKTVSYYVKGPVVGFLLDARIRAATGGTKSLDDVMRLAYSRYSGGRGFTAEEFRACADEVAGADLKEWFRRALELHRGPGPLRTQLRRGRRRFPKLDARASPGRDRRAEGPSAPLGPGRPAAQVTAVAATRRCTG
jgi:predicted metalloprotease with PDZ domain